MPSTRSPLAIETAICTSNRSALLDGTLARLATLQVPSGIDWRLLVIDNNSSDDTADVLAAHAGRLPLRSVFEPRPCLANARNRAVFESRADYLLWTDDDVLVGRNWLESYVAAFRSHPEGAFFGGPIEPWFDGSPPQWLADNWSMAEVAFDTGRFGALEFAFDDDHLPFGANCAVRLAIQRRFPYEPGPECQPTLGSDGTSVMRQMLAAGHAGWWVPGAAVQHFIPRERQSVAYLRRIFGGQGELQGRALAYGDVPRLLGRPRWLLKEAVLAEVRYRWSRATASPHVWIGDLIQAAQTWGKLRAQS